MEEASSPLSTITSPEVLDLCNLSRTKHNQHSRSRLGHGQGGGAALIDGLGET